MKDPILGPDAIEWRGVHYKTILSTADRRCDVRHRQRVAAA